MASDMRIRVGANASATISLNGPNGELTDAQVGQAIERAMREQGLPISGTSNVDLTTFLIHIKRQQALAAKRWHRRQEEESLSGQISNTVESNNNL